MQARKGSVCAHHALLCPQLKSVISDTVQRNNRRGRITCKVNEFCLFSPIPTSLQNECEEHAMEN